MSFKFFDPSKESASALTCDKGVFLVLLKKTTSLSIAVPLKAEDYPTFQLLEIDGNKYDVVYVGSTTNLQKRILDQCLNGTADKMTLRKSLGVLMGMPIVAIGGRMRFEPSIETRLTDWMKANLLFAYDNSDTAPDESSLIAQYNPPLNIKNNSNPVNREFRDRLKALRNPIQSASFSISGQSNNNSASSEVIKSGYSKTRIIIGIIVILFFIIKIATWLDNSPKEDGKTEYYVTENFFGATNYETAQTLSRIGMDNPNEPELANSYVINNADNFVTFREGDIVVVLKDDGYGYKVKRLSDGAKGIIPKRILSKR